MRGGVLAITALAAWVEWGIDCYGYKEFANWYEQALTTQVIRGVKVVPTAAMWCMDCEAKAGCRQRRKIARVEHKKQETEDCL